MMKRHGVYALLLLSLIGGSAYSQENQLVTGTIVQRPAQQVVSDDTIPAINLSEEELDNIVDIRKQFEKQNKTYSAPLAPSTNLLRFLKKTNWRSRTRRCIGPVWYETPPRLSIIR